MTELEKRVKSLKERSDELAQKLKVRKNSIINTLKMYALKFTYLIVVLSQSGQTSVPVPEMLQPENIQKAFVHMRAQMDKIEAATEEASAIIHSQVKVFIFKGPGRKGETPF